MSIMGLYGKYQSHKHKNKNRLQYITVIYQVKILSKSRSACWGSMRRTLTIPGEPRPAGAAGAGFIRSEPRIDIGVELGEVWEMVERLKVREEE